MFATVRQFVQLTRQELAFGFDPLLYTNSLPDYDRSRPAMQDHR